MFSSAIERFNEKRRNTSVVGEDAGFTLIELMVVLLILAILLAIAIPTFLGVTKSANDRAVQSNLNTAITNAKSYFETNQQSYGTAAAMVTAMATQEPSLQWTTGNSTSQSQISVFVDATTGNTADGSGVILAGLSKNNANCWYVLDNSQTQNAADAPYTYWSTVTANGTALSASGTFYAVQNGNQTGDSACNAATAPAAANTTVGTTFPVTP
ncbi:MAG: prepilin-type N-terminal cleavage/methylation domain-containing protein [Acidimicrobiales bacterium]